MRIGMKQAHAFGALYAMSSCCLMNDPAAGRGGAAGRGDAGRGAPQGRGAGQGTGQGRGGGMANALSAQAAAWAPNPKNPPQFFDLPTKDGEIQPLVAAKWVANSPLVFVDQYVPSLRSMRAIALDIGNQDPFAATNRQLADALTRLDVAHTYEVYDGDHGNRIRERFERHVLPFFSRHPEVAERRRGDAAVGGNRQLSATLHNAGADRLWTIGGGISHGRGFHLDVSDSFLNCELSTNSCVRYSGSCTTVVTISHVPSLSGSAKLSKNSLTVVRSLYGTPFGRRYPAVRFVVTTSSDPPRAAPPRPKMPRFCGCRNQRATECP
jgi:hypothetical protein